MEGKEEVLRLLPTTEFVSLTLIMREMKIQWYQAKLIATELLQEGKIESATFGKRVKYRKKTALAGHNGEIAAVRTPPISPQEVQDER